MVVHDLISPSLLHLTPLHCLLESRNTESLLIIVLILLVMLVRRLTRAERLVVVCQAVCLLCGAVSGAAVRQVPGLGLPSTYYWVGQALSLGIIRPVLALSHQQ